MKLFFKSVPIVCTKLTHYFHPVALLVVLGKTKPDAITNINLLFVPLNHYP